MALQTINLGTANGGNGTSIRAGGDMINDNFLFGWQPIGCGGTALTHTGNTSETQLAAVTVPAGALGTNGMLRVSMLWGNNNSGNNKIFRARLGGISGTAFAQITHTTNLALSLERLVFNRNAANSQIVSGPVANAGSWSAFTGAMTTMAVNTASAQDVSFTVELANGGDSATLNAYLVELLYRA